LTGGNGNDFFRFMARTEGIDAISDFSKVSGNLDKIQVLASGFGGGLTAGTLAASRFVLGTTATNTTQRFIYNQSNGALFFDIDGLGGTAQVQIATLSNKPGLVASDIVVA
jgi:Ca2+-binding RTX toxin-like protein